MANRHPRKRHRRTCATRHRRLLVEQFEPRALLATVAPESADAAISTLEDTPYHFQASDFPFADPFELRAPNSFQAVSIASLPTNGSLTFNNQPVVAGQFISVFQFFQFKFLPAPNANGPTYAQFTFQVQDDGGIANGGVDLDPTPNTLTINVTPVNDPPAGTDNSISMREDTFKIFDYSDFGLTDPADSPKNYFAAVKLLTVPTAGNVNYKGVPAVPGQWVSADDIFHSRLNYIPPPNASGKAFANFTFQLQDDGGTAGGGSDVDPTPNTITIDVTARNDPPTTEHRVITMLAGTTRTLTETDFSFSDPNDTPPNALKSVRLWGTSTGLLTFKGSPVYIDTYIPVADVRAGKLVFTAPQVAQPYQFTFNLTDDGGTANDGTDMDFYYEGFLTFVVMAQPNAPPSGLDGTVTTLENTTYAFKDKDFSFTDATGLVPNRLAAVRIATLPIQGALQIGGVGIVAGQIVSATDIVAGNLTFVPPLNTNGLPLTTFTFQAQDDGGTAGGGIDLDPTANTITIRVKQTNEAPVTTADAYSVNANERLMVANTGGLGRGVLANDTDVDNSTAAVRLVTPPAHGRVSLQLDGSFSYWPDIQFGGADQFTYQADDGSQRNNLSLIATVSLTVNPFNHAPVARDDRYQSLAKAAQTLKTTGVIYNDSDQDDDALSAILVTPATNGNVTLKSDGTFTYSPRNNYVGPDSFTYQLNDGQPQNNLSNIATVYLVAGDSPGLPKDSLMMSSEQVTTGINTPFELDYPGVLENDYSTRGNTLWIYYGSVGDSQTLQSLYLENSGRVIYRPPLNFVGWMRMGYYVADVESYSEALLNIRVTAAGNQAPLATDDSFSTRPNKPLAIDLQLLTNDADPDGDTLRVKIVDGPAHGTIARTMNGGIIYTPNTNYSGTDTFTYRANDYQLDSNLATVTITMAGTSPGHAPLGTDKSVTTYEAWNYIFYVSDFGFSDPNDAPADQFQAVRITTLPAAGSLMFDGVPVTAGQYISKMDIVSQKLKFVPVDHNNGIPYASFTFQVQDDGGTLAGGADLDVTPRTFTINIPPIVDPPSGSDFTVDVPENQAYTIRVADFGFNDWADTPPNNFVAVMIYSVPYTGVLRLNGTAVSWGQIIPVSSIAAGGLQYIPAYYGNGYSSFSFRVQDDGTSGSNWSYSSNTLTIRTLSVNSPPQGADKTVATVKDTRYTFSVADWGFSDWSDYPSNALKAVRISNLPGAGSLLLSDVAITEGQMVSITDIAADKLQFAPATNGKGANYAKLTFQVQDNGGTFNGGVDLDPFPNTITINVGTENVPPTGSDRAVTTLEDTPYTLKVSDFGFSDSGDAPPNGPNNLKAVKITAIPPLGSLKNNGGAVANGQSIPVADINSGEFTYTPPANSNGLALATILFQVQDDGGIVNGGVDLDPTPNTITIDVLAVNDAPAGGSRNLSLFCGSHTFTPSDFGFSDQNDNPANNLKSVRLVNLGGGTLTLNGAAYTNNLEVPFASLTSGSLVYTPSRTTPTTITFVVKDDGGTATAYGGNLPNGTGLDADRTPRVFNISVVLGPNTSPSGVASTVTVNEDNPYTFKASDFRFVDADGDNLKSVIIGAPLPQQGVLRLFNGVNFVDVTANQRIDAYDLNLGRLVFDPLPVNSNGPSFASVRFKVQDDGGDCSGGADTDPIFRQVTINVESVNDAPSGTNKSISVANGQPHTFSLLDFPISDPNDFPSNGLAAVRFMSLPAGGTLALGQTAVAAGQFVSATDIAARLLIYTPPAAGQPAGTLTFAVQDDGGTANGGVDLDPTPNSIYFLTKPNHPPEGTDRSITINEDNPASFTLADFPFTDSGDDFPNKLQSIKITSLPTIGQLLHFGQVVSVGQFISAAELSSSSTTLVFRPTANQSGSPYASFSFQLQDDGETASGGVDLDPTPNTFTINVTPVNDQPSFNHLPGNYSATDENPQTHDAAMQQCVPGWATDISPGPADESSQTVGFIVTSTNPNLFAVQPKVNAEGSFCYTPKANIAGTATIGVILQDNLGGASPTATFQIEVTKPHRLHNTVNPNDVAGFLFFPQVDGKITAGDALIVINYINAFGAGPIPADTPGGPPYLDVNADNSVAADDVLEIINWINAHTEESESPGNAPQIASDTSATNLPSTVPQLANDADLINMLAADAASAQLKRRRAMS